MDVVKVTMQDNIQQMLANEERLDQISENAENLNEQVSPGYGYVGPRGMYFSLGC